MPYYKLGSEAIGQSEKAFADNVNLIEELFYDEQGALILHTKKQLQKIKGLKKLDKEEYEGLHATLLEGIAKAKPNQPLPGMGHLELANDWKVEPYSSRLANITQLAIRPGVTAMNVLLGGGRGDTIYIGRPNVIPEQASLIRLKAQARCADGEDVTVNVVLTTERERPWLTFDPVKLYPGVWATLEFRLNHLNEKKLHKVDRINIAIMTEADEGYVLIQDMQLL